MKESPLEQLWREALALTRAEQRQLFVRLAALLHCQSPQMTEEEFERRLLEQGIISRLPAPMTESTRDQRKPIEAQGRPLSEIIIEERR